MPDDVTAITLRNPTDETLASFYVPIAIAFGEEFSAAEIEMEREFLELDRIFGAFEGETQVGLSGTFTFRMTTPGGEVGAAGVTLIGVMPTHRRRGILRLMMTRLFEQARERDEPVAILWASEAAIYQRFGFGWRPSRPRSKRRRTRSCSRGRSSRRGGCGSSIATRRPSDSRRSSKRVAP